MKKIALTLLVAGACAFAAAPASYATCKACHGEHGEKNTMVSASKPDTLSKADVKAALEGYKAGTRNTYGKGMMMKPHASRLTPEQIDELANYIGQ